MLLDLLKLDKDNLHTRTELSKIYQQQKLWDKAERVLLEYIEIEPQGLHPRTELSKIYQQQKQWDKAEQVLLDSLAIDDKQLHPRTELSKVYQRQQKYPQAQQVAQQALEIDSTNSFAMAELIRSLSMQKKADLVFTYLKVFLSQPQYHIGRHTQAVFLGFLLCCKFNNMRAEAIEIYNLYGKDFDKRNEQLFFGIAGGQ